MLPQKTDKNWVVMGRMSAHRATKGLSSQVDQMDTHLTYLEAGWKILYL